MTETETTIPTLYRDWLARRESLLASEIELNATLDRYLELKPAVPDELIHMVRGEGQAVSPMCRGGQDASGRDVDYRAPDFWRSQIKAIEIGPNSAFTLSECQRLLALSKKYEADVDRAMQESGHDDEDKRHEALCSAVWNLESRIAAAVPQTVEDVRLKALVVKHWMQDASTEHIIDQMLDSLISLPETKAA